MEDCSSTLAQQRHLLAWRVELASFLPSNLCGTENQSLSLTRAKAQRTCLRVLLAIIIVILVAAAVATLDFLGHQRAVTLPRVLAAAPVNSN